MRKLVYYVGVSIDGYIAGPGGEFDFYPQSDGMAAWISEFYPETVPTHVREQIGFHAPNRQFDTVVMGRGTYEPAMAIDVVSPYDHLKQYVVSTTLPEIDHPRVTVVRTDPLELVRKLKKEEGKDIWLCGGGKLAGALLPEIDELVIKSYPVIVGEGVSAFTGEFRPTLFTPTRRSEQFSNGAIVTWYSR
ncbi:dihydrofolate reductase family protein [Thermostaphylospora chromogena]|uniref:Dihydrofolate reductase n=1 Tax=Thermostaphylospora chromogena TaxID=35622 RepID=A0A1H1DKQ4_9ACTN|nr:dihydrofolate reductase family protein [Thermostaphylospora chromogena]SDQ76819.1 Dihydrofolate reductase [Thermostaphylospora chromogena]